MNVPVVTLRARRPSQHPWIWQSMVATRELPRGLIAGDEVRVVGSRGEALGRGLFHPKATIGIRMLTADPDEAIDAAFFERRLGEALRFRRETLRLEDRTDGYRIVHSEADGLSGLMVDKMGGAIALEVFSTGMARRIPEIKGALGKLLPGLPIIARADTRTSAIEHFKVPEEKGAPAASEVREDGVRFKVDLARGHKTGFFFDQRDNRARIAGLAKDASVLDLSCYTGGFSLRAAAAGARETLGIDLDENAVEQAKKNANLNQLRQAKFVHTDVFPWLRNAKRLAKTWDVVVLDPPKLAQGREELEAGLRKYYDLNRLAIEVVAPNGVFLTCSCSGVVTQEALTDVLTRCATSARREVAVFATAGAAPDHPVALHAPETGYLKAIFARVRGGPAKITAAE